MKIVIIGGGTAAWVTASYFLKNKDIKNQLTVIESEDIPIIGVGEGSSGLFTNYITTQLKHLGSNLVDFINETESTLKVGINFKNWRGESDQYYHVIDRTTTSLAMNDFSFLHNLKNGKPHLSGFGGHLLETNKSPYSKQRGEIMPIDSTQGFGFNFDGYKVGKYLKKLSESFYRLLNGTVVDANLDEKGFVTSVVLSDGREITGDLFIDCTGFERVLSKKLDNKWVSFKDELPVNSSMVYQRPYDDSDIIKPETLAHAHPNGWMFEVPVQKRFGTGYVYCDNFVTDEGALEEHEKIVGRKVTPNRIVKFENGKLEKLWKKNVLSIGLSGSFLEPLQATSIHFTLTQLSFFTQIYLRDNFDDTMLDINVESYNKKMDDILNEYKSMIQIHYVTGRKDTDFWKYMQNEVKLTDFNKYIIELCKYRVPSPKDFIDDVGYASWSVWSWTLAGIGLITPEMANKEIGLRNTYGLMSTFANEHEVIKDYISELIPNNEFVREILMKGELKKIEEFNNIK